MIVIDRVAFSEIPGDLSGRDILLEWGPDNQTLALSQSKPGQKDAHNFSFATSRERFKKNIR